MKVLKFGGTSVGSAERMKHVADILMQHPGNKIVVLSAMAGTTNKLVSLCSYLNQGNKSAAQELLWALEQDYKKTVDELFEKKDFIKSGNEVIDEHFSYLREVALGEYNPRMEKTVLAQGELLSTKLFHLLLSEQGKDAALIPALDFMKINEDSEPEINYIKSKLGNQLKDMASKSLFITQGFICRNAFGEIDNLKRGGSDYTASLIGSAISATEIQIWTDIDGMHNNDPRYVEPTKPISRLSYDEAAELAYFGAKILHPSSILPARFANIPVKLKNTLKPDAEGTLISSDSEKGKIKAIAAKDGIVAITIKSSRMLMAYGFLRAIFEVFERYKTPIDLITTSEVAVSVTIDDTTNLDAIVDDLRTYGMVEVDDQLSIVSVVGNSIGDQKGVANMVMHALKDVSIRMISYGGSKHNVSILIPTEYKQAALKSFNKEIFKL
ncbi:aspartate kinase [Luteibaculum oceani]|uniref:Aspartokinase n=1 Tax=Luteibaculum oceani TaxID=1294296 RepID=A0A5C6VA67_9FLAO|nr:aspartate kinase [Luteibaculum oceani]TXC82119.1 aspartate kinase [Luteibaculum oceani]